MRPIPHNRREGEGADERVRLTPLDRRASRRRRSKPDEDDEEIWLAVQEF
jgi:hypothetical protein